MKPKHFLIALFAAVTLAVIAQTFTGTLVNVTGNNGLVNNPTGTNLAGFTVSQSNAYCPAITGNGSVQIITNTIAHFSAIFVDPHPTPMSSIVQLRVETGFSPGVNPQVLFSLTNMTIGDTNVIKGLRFEPVNQSAVTSGNFNGMFITNASSNSVQIVYDPSIFGGSPSTDLVLVVLEPK